MFMIDDDAYQVLLCDARRRRECLHVVVLHAVVIGKTFKRYDVTVKKLANLGHQAKRARTYLRILVVKRSGLVG
jgi:hypothetical protein